MLPVLHKLRLLLLTGAVLLAVSAGVRSGDPADARPAVDRSHSTLVKTERSAQDPTDDEIAGLPNLVRVHPDVLSGGQPDKQDGYKSLRRLGVRTIISVDGVRPDVASARQSEINHIHLPHGYDRISSQRQLELAYAFLTAPRPIYVHCHHGVHRSPAAAAVGCIVAGLIHPKDGIDVLERAGTSHNYAGLWTCVRNARPAESRQLTALEIQFSESIDPPAVVQAMGELEQLTERLENQARNHWKTEQASVETSAAHAALLLREQFAELQRLEAIEAEPQAFRDQLTESLRQADLLVTLLNSAQSQSADAAGQHDPAMVLQSIRQSCRDCHRQFRD